MNRIGGTYLTRQTRQDRISIISIGKNCKLTNVLIILICTFAIFLQIKLSKWILICIFFLFLQIKYTL